MEQTIEYKGYTIKIMPDEDPMNPRIDWDPLGTMVCWHPRYDLGDMEHNGKKGRESHYTPISKNYSEPIDLLYELAGVERDEHLSENNDEDMSRSDLFNLIEQKGTVIKSLYLYDHSGITISTGGFSCPWDSGQIGWIYMDKKTQEENGWDKEKADACLEGEVETYDDFLTGNVYGFRIEDAEGEEVDSCWGFFGDPDEKHGCIDEAKSAIDGFCKKDQEEWEKQPKKRAAELYMV